MYQRLLTKVKFLLHVVPSAAACLITRQIPSNRCLQTPKYHPCVRNFLLFIGEIVPIELRKKFGKKKKLGVLRSFRIRSTRLSVLDLGKWPRHAWEQESSISYLPRPRDAVCSSLFRDLHRFTMPRCGSFSMRLCCAYVPTRELPAFTRSGFPYQIFIFPSAVERDTPVYRYCYRRTEESSKWHFANTRNFTPLIKHLGDLAILLSKFHATECLLIGVKLKTRAIVIITFIDIDAPQNVLIFLKF